MTTYVAGHTDLSYTKGSVVIFKRTFNFCWTHFMLTMPIATTIMLIEEFQRIFGIETIGGFAILYTGLIYFVSTISYTEIFQFKDGGLYVLSTLILLLYPFIMKSLSIQTKKILFRLVYPLCCIFISYSFSTTPYLIMIAYFYTLYDINYRQKKCYLIITKNDWELEKMYVLERNIVKVVCLSFVFIPIIYYWGTKKVLWDTICDTKVE